MNFKSFKAALGQAVATGTSYAKDLSTQVCAMCLPQWGLPTCLCQVKMLHVDAPESKVSFSLRTNITPNTGFCTPFTMDAQIV